MIITPEILEKAMLIWEKGARAEAQPGEKLPNETPEEAAKLLSEHVWLLLREAKKKPRSWLSLGWLAFRGLIGIATLVVLGLALWQKDFSSSTFALVVLLSLRQEDIADNVDRMTHNFISEK
jgi:hypothetical protein